MGPGGNIDATNGRVSIGSVIDDGNSMYTSTLQFTYLMEGDEGAYVCDAMILEAMVSKLVVLQSLTSKKCINLYFHVTSFCSTNIWAFM